MLYICSSVVDAIGILQCRACLACFMSGPPVAAWLRCDRQADSQPPVPESDPWMQAPPPKVIPVVEKVIKVPELLPTPVLNLKVPKLALAPKAVLVPEVPDKKVRRSMY